MSGHPLDRPVWHSLTGPHASLATVGGAAVRLDPAIGAFAAARDAGDEAQADLAALLRGRDTQAWLIEPEEWPAPSGAAIGMIMPLVQMTADAVPPSDPDFAAKLLGEADADAMAALVAATEPGPWARRTWSFGGYRGVKEDGRLVAMAGTRLRPCAEWREVSAVCTLPEYRGRGFAAALVRLIAAGLAAEGAQCFLHCHAENSGAIRLYESLGFSVRRTMVATLLVGTR